MKERTISRRGFVKGGVVAGAALGVPSIVPSSVFGKTAPSNRVNLGQIGCGNISGYHWGHLSKMDDVQVVAPVERLGTLLQRVERIGMLGGRSHG